MRTFEKVLGETIAELRRKAGLSQESLAYKCERHPTYISQIERGLKSPTVRTMARIGSVLGQAPSTILKRAEDAASKENIALNDL